MQTCLEVTVKSKNWELRDLNGLQEDLAGVQIFSLLVRLKAVDHTMHNIVAYVCAHVTNVLNMCFVVCGGESLSDSVFDVLMYMASYI